MELHRLPLLQAKLHPPALRARFLPRQRLLDQLLSDLDGKLTLVSAPVGFGKTTLLVQWCAGLDRPTAWLSLDERDDDLGLFLSYLIGAIQYVFPEACKGSQGLLQSPNAPPPDVLGINLANELAALPMPLVLVLDDYHVIHARDVHALMEQIVAYLPPQVHLVISTRSDPAIPLASLAIHGELNEIRAADLRFRSGEANAFLAQRLGQGLPVAALEELIDRTEGWIAALTLTCQFLSSESDQQDLFDHLPESGVAPFIDYLASQVLAGEAPEVQDFMIKTSILEHFSAGLCDAVLGKPSIAGLESHESNAGRASMTRQLLKSLAESRSFVNALDATQTWYRYHHLLRDALRSRLKKTYDPDEIAALHVRAAGWWLQQAFVDEAMHHALAAGRPDLAADAMIAYMHVPLNNEERRTFDRWLARLPEAEIRRRPELLLARAWSNLLQEKVSTVSLLLSQAEELLAMATPGEADPAAAVVRGQLAVLHAHRLLLVEGKFAEAVAVCQRALALLPPHWAFCRSLASMFLGMALYASGERAQGVALLEDLVADPSNSPGVRLQALTGLTGIHRLACDHEAVLRTGQVLVQLASEANMRVSMAWGHAGLATIAYERNELDRAAQHFRAAADYGAWADFLCLGESLHGLALNLEAQAMPEAASAAVQELVSALNERSVLVSPVLTALQARLALARGDREIAAQVVIAIADESYEGLPVTMEFPAITCAQAWLASDLTDLRAQAMTRLAELQGRAKHMGSDWHLVRVLALQALGLYQQGLQKEAIGTLERAVLLGRRGPLIRTFVDLGPELVPLLQALLDRGVERRYLGRVLAAFSRHALTVPEPRPAANHELLEPLTNREMDVLFLLNQRLTNKEIAAQLIISPLTVKTHINRIMQKLEASNRREATTRARELGLFKPS